MTLAKQFKEEQKALKDKQKNERDSFKKAKIAKSKQLELEEKKLETEINDKIKRIKKIKMEISKLNSNIKTRGKKLGTINRKKDFTEKDSMKGELLITESDNFKNLKLLKENEEKILSNELENLKKSYKLKKANNKLMLKLFKN